MTGTPPGVGWFQDPQLNLQDGDIVEIEITGIGKLSNIIRFE
jgi:2-keto-4-pentenoate hydratase/2-oxohepta-3-ene-1,7-dioic acid hydratase in catechol pathway